MSDDSGCSGDMFETSSDESKRRSPSEHSFIDYGDRVNADTLSRFDHSYNTNSFNANSVDTNILNVESVNSDWAPANGDNVNNDAANRDSVNNDAANRDSDTVNSAPANGDTVVHTNDSQDIHNELFLMGHCFSGNDDFSPKHSPGNSQAIFNPKKHWHFSNKPE